MRKSVKVTDITKKKVASVKRLKYANARVTDSYVINEAIKGMGYEMLKERLSSVKAEQYQSIRYTLDYEANDILTRLMDDGYPANSVIAESLKQMEKFEMYRRRCQFLSTKNGMKIVGTSGSCVDQSDYLPMIYSVSLKSKNGSFVLYVGKTKLFASREVDHIMSVYDDPAYFGLTDEDLSNDNLELIFKKEVEIDVLSCSNMQELNAKLSIAERETVDKLHPVTQNGMNMIADNEEKRKMVLKVLEKLGVSGSSEK